MPDARNDPRMDGDPVRPCHGVAGSPVGYQHGMRGEAWGTGQMRDVAKGKGDIPGVQTQQNRGIRAESSKRRPRGNGKLVAMEWGTSGVLRGTWPREVRKIL